MPYASSWGFGYCPATSRPPIFCSVEQTTLPFPAQHPADRATIIYFLHLHVLNQSRIDQHEKTVIKVV